MKTIKVNIDSVISNAAVANLLHTLFETGWAPREDQVDAAVASLPARQRKSGRAFIEKVIELKTSPKAYRAHKIKVKEELTWNRDVDKAYRVKLFREANPQAFANLEGQKAPTKKEYLYRRR